MDTRRRPTLVGLLLVFVMVDSAPALAQADFSGNWAPLFHEDHPERLPGPELGDYLGIPLNEAGRLRADSYDADRISELACGLHDRALADRPGPLRLVGIGVSGFETYRQLQLAQL